MALIVENASGNSLPLDELGITLATGEISDISLRGTVQDIINSAQPGEELSNLITSGALIIKDPADGVTNLSIADGLACARSYADPNYRVGAGARLGDISDVDISGVTDGFVIRYNNGTGNYETVTPSTITNDLDVTASQVNMDVLGSPTYTTLQNYIETQSSGGIVSGGFVTDGGAGTVDITAGTVWIRDTDSDVASIYSANFAGVTGQVLNDNANNFIYIQYNGGNPQITVSAFPLADVHTNIITGVVYRDGTTVHVTNINTSPQQIAQRLGKRFAFVDGVTRQSGSITTETGTRNIAMTTGQWWLGLTEYTIGAIDTSVSDTFSYYYQDGLGGVTEVPAQTQIDNTQYDDGSGTLAALTGSRYGVHWVYRGLDGDTYVIYGLGNYTLAQAEAAQHPTVLPGQIANELHTALVAKIIIQRLASSFLEIQYPFDEVFAGQAAPFHSDLTGLAWDVSGHTGTANQLAAFSGAGAATYVDYAPWDAHLIDTGNPHSTSLDNLTNVTITTPSDTQVLTYSGGTWINADAGAGSDQNLFETFATPAGGPIVADTPTDTLTFAQSNGISITGDAGTDTITIAPGNDLAALEALASTGIAVRTGAETWAQRTITGTADQTTITNGAGVAGDPTIAIADNPILPGTESVTLPDGTTAQRPVSPLEADTRYNTDLNVIEYWNGTSWVKLTSGDQGDSPSVVARRTTNFSYTSSWTTVTFDTTDLENDATVVSHDDVTNTSRITFLEDGIYTIYYQMDDVEFTANGELIIDCQQRLIKNGVATAVAGGSTSVGGYTGSTLATAEPIAPSKSIMLSLTAGDYLELQAQYVVRNGQTGETATATGNCIFMATKNSGTPGADGADGAQGPAGSGSTINVYDEGIIVTNSPFDAINFIGSTVTASDGGGGQVDVTISGSTVEFDRDSVLTTTNFSTTSTTPVDLTGSTITTGNLGGVGDYVITFSCDYLWDDKTNRATFSLLVNGSTVVSRRATGSDNKNADWNAFSLTHLAKNVASGTIVKMQVSSSDGTQLDVGSRELVIDGVLSALTI